MVQSKNQALLELATAVLRSEATAILDAADMLDAVSYTHLTLPTKRIV